MLAGSIWVGGIPESLVAVDMTASTDLESSPLAKLFCSFGTIVSLTTRQKPGLNKSWAFITYEKPAFASAALDVKLKHGSVLLQVEVGFFLFFCDFQ